jgi:hypothetical protein
MTLQVPESPAHLCRSPRSVPRLENEAFLKKKQQKYDEKCGITMNTIDTMITYDNI